MSLHKFCNCQTEPRRAPPRAPSQPAAPSDSTCSHHGNVLLPSIIPSLDVTAEYIGSVELLRADGSDRQPPSPPGHSGHDTHDHGSDLQLPGKRFLSVSAPQQRHRARRQTRRYMSNSGHQSLSQADLEGFAYFFPEDHEAAAQPDTSLTWPTPSGLSEQQARAQCLQAVVNSSIMLGCRRLLEEPVTQKVVDMCVTDLQLKDELLWLNATLPLLENECERRLVEQRRREEEYQDVLAALRCPNLCNWNGQCSEWGCVCFPGFGSYDCSLLSGKIK